MKFKIEFDIKKVAGQVKGRGAQAKENMTAMKDAYKETRASKIENDKLDSLDYLQNLIDWNVDRVRKGNEIYIPAKLDKESERIVRLIVARETEF